MATTSEPAARLLWYTFNVLCFVLGAWWWTIAWRSRVTRLDGSAWLHDRALWAALLAILLPLQTNFEHQNMNPLLLALTGGAACALTRQRAVAAGSLIGFAAAIKVFPALLIVYFGLRRLWRPLAASVAVVATLTALPLLVYGREGFTQQLARWLEVGTGGWPTRGANQSLIAAIDRIVFSTPPAVRRAADGTLPLTIYVVAAAALLAAAWPILGARRRQATVVPEMAAMTTLAVLLSPIAWDHYWVLLLPAFLVVYTASSRELLGGPPLSLSPPLRC